jgi:hypothetical protein
MITFWNRQEVYFGYSLHDFNYICDILHSNNIKYKYSIIDQERGSFMDKRRGEFGSFGLRPEYSKQYYLYVNKNDYEKADFLIRRVN